MATVPVIVLEEYTVTEQISSRFDPEIPTRDDFTVTERVSVFPADPANWPITPPCDTDF